MGVGYRVDHGRRDSFLKDGGKNALPKRILVSLKILVFGRASLCLFHRVFAGIGLDLLLTICESVQAVAARQHDRIGKASANSSATSDGQPVRHPGPFSRETIHSNSAASMERANASSWSHGIVPNPARHGTERADRATP